MKPVFLFVFLLLCLHFTSYAQNSNPADWQKYVYDQNLSASKYRLPTPSASNTPPPGTRLTVAKLFDPGALKNFVKREKIKMHPAVVSKKYSLKRSLNNVLCIDTSFVRLLNTYASQIFVSKATPTADGGVLIPAVIYDTTLKPQYTWRSTALLIRADDMGNVTWMKQFDNSDQGMLSTFSFNNAFELPGKDIICVGNLDTTSGGNQSNAVIYRLDKDGNIIWRNALHNSITNALPGSYSISITGVAEGLNGDVILGEHLIQQTHRVIIKP
jgi:hypothetical protein